MRSPMMQVFYVDIVCQVGSHFEMRVLFKCVCGLLGFHMSVESSVVSKTFQVYVFFKVWKFGGFQQFICEAWKVKTGFDYVHAASVVVYLFVCFLLVLGHVVLDRCFCDLRISCPGSIRV